MEQFKEAIIQNLPEDKHELSWSADEVGKILFKDKWEKLPQMVEPKLSNSVIGILQVIQSDGLFPSDKEKNELYNHVFSESVNRLVDKSESIVDIF